MTILIGRYFRLWYMDDAEVKCTPPRPLRRKRSFVLHKASLVLTCTWVLKCQCLGWRWFIHNHISTLLHHLVVRMQCLPLCVGYLHEDFQSCHGVFHVKILIQHPSGTQRPKNDDYETFKEFPQEVLSSNISPGGTCCHEYVPRGDISCVGTRTWVKGRLGGLKMGRDQCSKPAQWSCLFPCLDNDHVMVRI